jgi:hypothetical protein
MVIKRKASFAKAMEAKVVPKGLISNKIISFFKNLYINLRGSVAERIENEKDLEQ